MRIAAVRWRSAASRPACSASACATRAREAVEQEAVLRLGRLDGLEDDAGDDLVGHELAGVHELLGLLAELALGGHGGAQHVARRDVRQVEVVGQPLGLRALAGAGRTEEDEIELRHRRDRA